MWINAYILDGQNDFDDFRQRLHELEKSGMFIGALYDFSEMDDGDIVTATVYSDEDMTRWMSNFAERPDYITKEMLPDLHTVIAVEAVRRTVTKDLLPLFGEILLSRHPECRVGNDTVEDAIMKAAIAEYDSRQNTPAGNDDW